jgi:hypothetical protein
LTIPEIGKWRGDDFISAVCNDDESGAVMSIAGRKWEGDFDNISVSEMGK